MFIGITIIVILGIESEEYYMYKAAVKYQLRALLSRKTNFDFNFKFGLNFHNLKTSC